VVIPVFFILLQVADSNLHKHVVCQEANSKKLKLFVVHMTVSKITALFATKVKLYL